DEATGTGTGWVVDRESRLMVTNHHVVHHLGRRANQIRVCFPVRDEQNEIIAEAAHYRRTVLKSGIKARVVFTSPERDLALLQLDRLPQGTNALPLAATSIRPGEAVASVGNPARSEACWVFNSGTVRQIYRRTFRANKQNIAARMVETQQPIASGDSGSPMLNFKGEVVGVISSTKEDAPLFNYGIDLTELRAFLEQAGTGDQASAPDRTDSENSGRGDKYGSRPRSFSGIARAADGND
ncbi:MAG TPA: trypsin-like peptidase domain-containing protein, partial [Gemmatales bacterium]|nr:trypsin-like peptidase domain-containing protein [Gemmatales bacterium]